MQGYRTHNRSMCRFPFPRLVAGALLAALLVAVLGAGPAAAQVLTGVTAAASSFQSGREPVHVVDGSGLTETPPGSGVFTCSADPYFPGGNFFNSAYLNGAADINCVLTFDLGKSATVDAFHVWNDNENAFGYDGTPRGFRDVAVLTSDDGVSFLRRQEFSFARAPGVDTYAGEDCAFVRPVTARFLRFQVLSNYGGDVSGLSEVRFHAAPPAAAPPPPVSDVRFPADAVVNVKLPPYSAKGDGIADDTAALQSAIDENQGTRRIIYLPNGTYRLTGSLALTPGRGYGLTNIRGQSTGRVVLRLADRTFTDPAAPKAVLDMAYRPGGFAGAVAQWFSNNVGGFTVDTGRGNPGAIGIKFYSNNEGSLRDVLIRSRDGAGVAGVDLAYGNENGPLLVKNLAVIGFGIGVKAGNTVNSQTLENVALCHQTRYGLYNGGQCLSIRRLASINAVPGVYNAGGTVALVDAAFWSPAGRAGAAVVNADTLFARNLIAYGYGQAIQNSAPGGAPGASGPSVAEWVSSPVLSLFPTPARSLGLPVKETPDVPWDDPKAWASAVAYGADPSGSRDSTVAIQEAIDSGASTVYLPTGGYKIGGTVLLRGAVRRLLGTHAYLDISGSASPAFKVVAGSAPAVAFENFESGYNGTPDIENASARTLVVRDCTNISGNMTGAGDVFVEDVCANPFSGWTFGAQNVWARQLNVENDGTHVLNNGGRLWVLGLKTERPGTLIDTEAGGRTELLGGLCYTTYGGARDPMFINAESSLSLTLGEVWYNTSDSPYTALVRETRGGVTRTLGRGDAPIGISSGSLLPLYVGYP